MASAMHEPMLCGGRSTCFVIDSAGVGKAVRGLAPLHRDVRLRSVVRVAAAGNRQRLSDHLLAVDWVYRSISITVEDDGRDDLRANGQPASSADPHAANRYIIVAHHRERGW